MAYSGRPREARPHESPGAIRVGCYCRTTGRARTGPAYHYAPDEWLFRRGAGTACESVLDQPPRNGRAYCDSAHRMHECDRAATLTRSDEAARNGNPAVDRRREVPSPVHAADGD